MPLPRPPNFNERDVSDKPRVIRRRPRLNPAEAAAVQENYRQELESLLSVDDAVGQLLDTLERTGKLANTIVIFTSDNGYTHGEHRIRAAKVFPYEPSIRVPLLMRGPGVPAGLHYGQQAGNIDLAPTILDAADALPGRLQDGSSLLSLAADPQKRTGRELVLENGRGLRTLSRYRGLRNDRYVYIRHDRTGARELYDLRRDPFQLKNLATDERFRRVRILMDRRVRKLSRCRGQLACGASRPAIRVRGACTRRGYTVTGREKHRVRRVVVPRPRPGIRDHGRRAGGHLRHHASRVRRMTTYARLEAAFAGRDAPFAFVDLDAMWSNAHEMLGRAGPKPIRVASKSVRCRELLERILAHDPRFRGLMTFTLAETLWLHSLGFDDLLLAYPTTDAGRAGRAGRAGG